VPVFLIDSDMAVSIAVVKLLCRTASGSGAASRLSKLKVVECLFVRNHLFGTVADAVIRKKFSGGGSADEDVYNVQTKRWRIM
jgi:hypothetical protein